MSPISLLKKRVFGGLLSLAAVAAWAPAIRADVTMQPATRAAELPLACVPREQCCKVCSKGKACGNTCIKADYNCHKGPGCACDAEDVCE
jgi:hypothetical protein